MAAGPVPPQGAQLNMGGQNCKPAGLFDSSGPFRPLEVQFAAQERRASPWVWWLCLQVGCCFSFLSLCGLPFPGSLSPLLAPVLALADSPTSADLMFPAKAFLFPFSYASSPPHLLKLGFRFVLRCWQSE